MPSVHCAACISTVERGLGDLAEVRAARVNLTQKQVRVEVADSETAEDRLLDRLAAIGHPGVALDGDTLAKGTADPVGRALLLRLGISGFAAMNVMLLSVAVWSGAEGVTRDFLHWISAAIALPTALFAAQPFFRNAWAALKVRRLVMDTPISLAILLALGMSLYETAAGGAHAYFDAALSLTFFLLLGRVLDHRSRRAARSAAAELAALDVPRATRVGADGTTQRVAVAEVAVGDILRVPPGMRVPADGVVVSGESDLDRAFLTGESAPVPLKTGEPVSAGEVNLTGLIDIRVTAAGEDTQLARIAELVRAAESAKHGYVTLADRAAKVYAPLVHSLAAIAAVGWYIGTGDLRLAINIATAVLIITCPCALGLAVPSVMVAASGALFRQGVLLKDGAALERLARVDTVLLDKTGTLTSGVPELTGDVRPEDLALAAGLGAGSMHPLAQGLAIAAHTRGIAPAEVSDLREVPGSGVEARFEGQRVRLGRLDWVGGDCDTAPPGGATTFLRLGDHQPVRFSFVDHPRRGLEQMLEGLRKQVRDIRVISGDADGPTQALAARFGIGVASGGMSPQQKQAEVAALSAAGNGVLMLGDGLNDTAALAKADVSIAPASGIDAARTAADIILLRPDLDVVPRILRVARSARARILENFALAAAYNAVAIPIALSGHATPLMAALAMSGSSICVSLNALRVRQGVRA
nr:heavy metal translocating P-type ATPase [Oceanibium sediminis]